MKGFILEVKSCCVLSIVHSGQVKIMQLFFIWMMMFTFHTGSSEDLVKPLKDVMLALEGDNVTLSCNYSTSVDYFFWYQQKSSSSPQFLIREYSNKTGFSLDHNKEKKEFHLQMSSAAVTDSAVYYCAVRNQAGNKLYFGRGTKLTVESEGEYKPSYYALRDGDTTVCLATGFSRINGTYSSNCKEKFNETGAVRIFNDSLYNQVAFLKPDSKCKCQEDDHEPANCEETLEPDPIVNLMSLTILGLRVIFIKTIIFNVLMTFRLWISQ